MFRFAAAAVCRNPAEAVHIRNLRPADLGLGMAAPADTVQLALILRAVKRAALSRIFCCSLSIGKEIILGYNAELNCTVFKVFIIKRLCCAYIRNNIDKRENRDAK